MNRHLQNFMDSFNSGKDFLYFFLADLVTFSLIFVIFSWFTAYLQQKSFEVMQGKSMEELQQILASSNPEQVLPFLNSLRSFLIWAVAGIIILAVLSFLLYSLSRAVIWYHVGNKKVTKKTYWRWNLLNLSLIIPLSFFLLIFFVVKILASTIVSMIFTLFPVFFAIHSKFAENFRLAFNGAVSFYLVLSFLVIIFMIYNRFSHNYKVWESLGSGFGVYKKNWKKLSVMVLFAAVVALAVSLAGIVVKGSVYSPTILMFFNLALGSAFLAWLRLYVLKAVSHGHN